MTQQGGSTRNGLSGVLMLWRTLTLVLFGVIVTGAGTWFAFAQDRPDRREVGEMIVLRQLPIRTELQGMSAQLEDIKTTLRSIEERLRNQGR